MYVLSDKLHVFLFAFSADLKNCHFGAPRNSKPRPLIPTSSSFQASREETLGLASKCGRLKTEGSAVQMEGTRPSKHTSTRQSV